MRLASISIKNMARFESFETKLPAVAIVQGKNGDGKTSFLDCIRYAFGRGHNPDMIHADAPEGEILIEFDNGAAIKCVAKRERNETVRSWRAPGTKRFIVSREEIDAIANAISYDPLAFIDKSEKEQIEILLRIMPIECSDEEIRQAIGDVDAQPMAEGNALVRIDTLRKQIYNQRHDLNVAADAQEKHVQELEKTLPPPAPGEDWNAEVLRLQKEKEALEAEQAKRLEKIRELFEEEKAAAQKDYEATLAAAAKARDHRIEAARGEANQAAGKIRTDNAPQLEKLTSDLATAQERARRTAEAEGTRKTIEQTKADAEAKRAQAKRRTDAIERLDKLKETVAGRLKGFTIEDGRIVRDEGGKTVPFSRWNTESKMRFALRIAVQAHGPAGFIVIDNAEHFDSEKRMGLINTAEKYAEKDGLQFIIASVSDQPLSVSEAKA